jgi:diguanylate cyclase (GGDEF)-like protein/PAS domain S-box-containing protein
LSTQSTPHSVAYLRFRRRLLTGLLLMAALAITLVLSQFHAAYLERESAVRKQTEHYVKAMEAHVLYSIQFVDLSLLGFANAIKVLPAKQAMSPETISALLSTRRTTFTNDYWITFVDAQGNAVATSNNLSVSGISYADRDYFKVHVNNSMQDKLFVGEPALGKASEQKLFFLSRRVENARGEFLGVIVAPLDATRFAKTFESSRFSPDVSIALVHRGGKIIARSPGFEESFQRDLSSTPLFENVRKNKFGTYKATSVIDQIARIYSFRVLDNVPLIIVVGSSDAESARLQEQNFLIAGAGLSMLLILMSVGGLFSLRSYTRLEERELRYRQLYTSSREMEQKLSASEQRLRLIADNLPIMIGYIDKDEHYTFTNRKFDTAYGLAPHAAEGKLAKDVVDPETYAQSIPEAKRALQGEQVYFERCIHTAHGDRWDGVTYVPDRTKEGQIPGLFVMVEDITQRKKTEESMQLATLLYQNCSQGMMVTDADGRILSVNPAFTQMSGYAEPEVMGRHAYELTSGREDQEFFTRMHDSIVQTGQWEGELWHQHKNGEQYLVWLRYNTVYDNDQKPYRYVALFSDITKKKASEELIWKQANFDALTGLPNRRKFYEHLRLEMKKTDRSQLPMALVFVDLDYFKEINDTLGHDKGDILLKEVANRLTQCVRGTDTVSRLGGDEFTVIISELHNSADMARIAQDILTKMSAPFTLGDDIAHISASIGITTYPDDGNSAEILMKNADQAMYAAKQQGRNRFNYFAPFMQEATRDRLNLSNELRDAVSRNELRILYQPIIELASGRILKAEALVRWQHPTRGLLNPADFISIAENTGMIVEIGDWVFHQAAKEAQRLQRLGVPGFQVCVNKSAWQFRDEGSNYKQWLDFLADLDVPPRSIVIEVTENLLLDSTNSVAERLQAFQHAEMQLSLDDFGTGYASIAFLKRYDIDYIKIDPTFVRNLSAGTDGTTLCEAIIAMAHTLDIKVIAEGIETPQQMEALKSVGCDFGQGYLFSKPIPSEELEQKVQKSMAPVDNSLDIHRTSC